MGGVWFAVQFSESSNVRVARWSMVMTECPLAKVGVPRTEVAATHDNNRRYNHLKQQQPQNILSDFNLFTLLLLLWFGVVQLYKSIELS